jgi:hypothetical protein
MKLFNGMHITSDRQALENGRRMQKILEVTQDETRIAGEMARQNQLLAEDMKNDSVAMKTVRLCSNMVVFTDAFGRSPL